MTPEAKQRPSFCWDRSWSADDVRRLLREAEGFQRDQLKAWIMREARFSEVWDYLTPQEAYEALPRIEPFLGRWRDMWKHVFRIWHELGRV